MSGSSAQSPSETPTFLSALFDTTFQHWVTLRVAGILYFIGMVVWGIVALITAILIGMSIGGIEGIIVAILAFPLIAFIAVLTLRLVFESSIALVAIARNTERR